jgi:hypothetical protein
MCTLVHHQVNPASYWRLLYRNLVPVNKHCSVWKERAFSVLSVLSIRSTACQTLQKCRNVLVRSSTGRGEAGGEICHHIDDCLLVSGKIMQV